jgi:hypothetical protein
MTFSYYYSLYTHSHSEKRSDRITQIKLQKAPVYNDDDDDVSIMKYPTFVIQAHDMRLIISPSFTSAAEYLILSHFIVQFARLKEKDEEEN